LESAFASEGAVDELGAGVLIKQHDADVDLVQRGRQPCRERVLGALMRKGVHQLPADEPGDRGRAARRHREHGQPDQVGDLVAGRCAVVEEEQRQSDNRDRGAGQRRAEAAP